MKYHTIDSRRPTKKEHFTIENLLAHSRIKKLLYPDEYVPSIFRMEYWKEDDLYYQCKLPPPIHDKIVDKLPLACSK
jgi:hypothetical protein